MFQKRSILNHKNIFQILCMISLLSAIVAMIIARSSPAVGYESSIYRSTPIVFWIVIFTLIILGLIIIIYNILYEKLDQSRMWIVGMFLIYLSYIMCISLFIIRGYPMWCINGDPATHIGYVNQIILSSHLPAQLYYPALHIYTSQLFFISNIDIITLHKILPLIFGILYIPFIYLFSKSVFSEKNQILLSTVAGSTLINGWYLNFTPNGLSNLFFPLLFLIIFKLIYSRGVRWELLTLAITFLYPIFHPIPTLTFLIIVCTLYLPNYIFTKLSGIKIIEEKRNQSFEFKITLLILLLVWGITWLSSFYVWDKFITNIHLLITEGGPTHISSLIHDVNYAEAYGYNVIELILKELGGSIAYALITIIPFIIFYKNKDIKKPNRLFSLYGPFLLLCPLIIVLYFTNTDLGPLRMTTYITMMSTPFVGYLLNFLIGKIKNNNLAEHKRFFNLSFIGLVFLLIIVWINGILVLYPSPYTLESNQQTTLSEMDGMGWLFENKNLDLEIIGITITPFRYADFLLTPEQKHFQKLHYWEKPEDLTIPFHFGYDNNTLLSDYYNQNVYLGVTEEDKLLYTDVFPKLAKIRWVPNDFEKLNNDTSLKKIYSNEEFEVFYIDGLGKL